MLRRLHWFLTIEDGFLFPRLLFPNKTFQLTVVGWIAQFASQPTKFHVTLKLSQTCQKVKTSGCFLKDSGKGSTLVHQNEGCLFLCSFEERDRGVESFLDGAVFVRDVAEELANSSLIRFHF